MRPDEELLWRTATYSSNGENCVEVAPTSDGAIIRHSKHPDAGTVHFSRHSWSAFIRDAAGGGAATGNGVAVITKSGGDTLVRSLAEDVELRFDEGEWSSFLAGAADGEFDFSV